MQGLAKVVATFFGIGFIPFIPATWASALAAWLSWFIHDSLLYWAIGLSAVGLWACAPSRKALGADDPGPFVMDEVCGMMLSLLWLPKEPAVFVAAFFLFRLFDTWKPWPISRIQASPHPWSVMLDDLAAGIVTNSVLQIAVRTFWEV